MERFIKRVVMLLIGPLLTILLSGCAVFQFVISNDQGRDPQSYTTDYGGVIVTIWTDHSCYKDKEPILVRLTFDNTSNNSVVFDGGDQAGVDIVLYDGQNKIYWSKTDGELDASPIIEIKPGETYEVEWSITPPNYLSYHLKGVWSRAGNEHQLMASFSGFPECPGIR